MTVNRIGGQGNLPSQINTPQNTGGEEAFNEQFGKSEGYDKGSLEKAVNERTRLSRTKKIGKSTKSHSSLFVVSDTDGEIHEEAVYRTIMVDGILFTLRLLAIA